MEDKKWSKDEILECAQDLGLDPFPVDLHVVPSTVLYDVAGRSMPGRYSHWSHGKQFYDGITRHDYKFGRVYELIINSNPCQAFLLDINSEIINIMVTAHVYGHSDYFKNNIAFQETDRDMHINAVKRAERIRRYEEEYGEDEVRQVLDSALTVEFYVDRYGYDGKIENQKGERGCKRDKGKNEYSDILSLGKKERPKEVDYLELQRFAGLPCDDILAFLITKAPIEDWKKDILSIVRQDGLYFWPQIKTKISNEGFSVWTHQKIMQKLDISGGEFIEYAQVNAGVSSAHEHYINPYWLGLQIFKNIEKRFGIERVFEVRRIEIDTSFLRNYLTKDLIEDLNLVRYKLDGDYYKVKTTEWEAIRNGLINDMTSRFPAIRIINTNHDKGGLLLEHIHDGRDLRKHSAIKVLKHLEELWGDKAYLKTIYNKKEIIWGSNEK